MLLCCWNWLGASCADDTFSEMVGLRDDPLAPLPMKESEVHKGVNAITTDKKETTKKLRDDSTQLTMDQEVEAVSWFQENKCLYDKSLREYRDTEKKNKIYQDKVHELGVTGENTFHIVVYMRFLNVGLQRYSS